MKVRIKSFKKTVSSSGTPERISSKQILTNSAKIRALAGNTGKVYIGGSDAQEYELDKGQEVSLTEMFEKDGGSSDIDLQEIYCKVATNSDSVCVIYADRTNPLS